MQHYGPTALASANPQCAYAMCRTSAPPDPDDPQTMTARAQQLDIGNATTLPGGGSGGGLFANDAVFFHATPKADELINVDTENVILGFAGKVKGCCLDIGNGPAAIALA